MARFEAQLLHSAIEGLIHECADAAEPTLIQHWVELVHGYVLRFAQPLQQDDRLKLLWERVVSHLGDHWTLARLAKEAGYSNEHLRRLCRRQLGRSPMHQVIYLRMRRAAELLATSPLTIEAIAADVGYHNPFVFSNAFTKWIGWRPSEYRWKKQSGLEQGRGRGFKSAVLFLNREMELVAMRRVAPRNEPTGRSLPRRPPRSLNAGEVVAARQLPPSRNQPAQHFPCDTDEQLAHASGAA